MGTEAQPRRSWEITWLRFLMLLSRAPQGVASSKTPCPKSGACCCSSCSEAVFKAYYLSTSSPTSSHVSYDEWKAYKPYVSPPSWLLFVISGGRGGELCVQDTSRRRSSVELGKTAEAGADWKGFRQYSALATSTSGLEADGC